MGAWWSYEQCNLRIEEYSKRNVVFCQKQRLCRWKRLAIACKKYKDEQKK